MPSSKMRFFRKHEDISFIPYKSKFETLYLMSLLVSSLIILDFSIPVFIVSRVKSGFGSGRGINVNVSLLSFEIFQKFDGNSSLQPVYFVDLLPCTLILL